MLNVVAADQQQATSVLASFWHLAGDEDRAACGPADRSGGGQETSGQCGGVAKPAEDDGSRGLSRAAGASLTGPLN